MAEKVKTHAPQEQQAPHHTSNSSNSSPSTAKQDESLSFQLKASRITLTQLELYDYSYDTFNQQMSKVLKQAPHFFNQTPVVVSLDKIRNTDKKIDFFELIQLCQEYGVFPIAVRDGTEEMQLSALVAGLPPLHSPTRSKTASDSDVEEKVENEIESTTSPSGSDTSSAHCRPTKIIKKPVRSGQQIYAQGCDLVVLGAVSAGAEVLADGNIHIYAPLRGRALAGIQGNKNCHIFCQQLEAELLSIAGHYKVSDDLQGKSWGKTVHGQLEGQQLVVTCL